MDRFPFIFTIFLMLLGPLRVIPAFAELTRDTDTQFKRALAIRASAIATALVFFVAFVGDVLLDKYHISLSALRISGGLVLLISALNTIFHKTDSLQAKPGRSTMLQLAASPLAAPIIVPPAGVAAILIFIMLAPDYPGTWQAVSIALAIIMILNFLVMYFIDVVMKAAGLMMLLQVLGAVLIFMQVCIGVDVILKALKDLGVITGRGSL